MWPKNYDALTAWRGIGALIVVYYHCSPINLGHWTVMVFFVISGYCISASAEKCKETNVGILHFLKRRVYRIYPPYLFAILFFILTRIAKMVWYQTNPFQGWDWLFIVQNLTLTQGLSLLFHPVHHAPANPDLMVTAFWSLGYEEQFYLLTALGLFLSLRYKPLALHVFLGALTISNFIWIVFFGDYCYGFFFDFWFLFGLGWLVYVRLTKDLPFSIKLVIDSSLAFISLGLLWAKIKWGSPEPRFLFTELLTGFLFSLFIIHTRKLNDWLVRSWLWPALFFLGTISYSLYLVNQFNLTLVDSLASRFVPRDHWPLGYEMLAVIFHIIIATVFWFFCERPFLNKPLKSSSSKTNLQLTQIKR